MVTTSEHRSTLGTAEIVELGRATIRLEAACLAGAADALDDAFAAAVALLAAPVGRIIVTGIGKSGHVAHKIAGTLTSTGSPAVFLHAAEAAHGDLGIITAHDCVLAVSHSGATPEVLRLLPRLAELAVPSVAIVGHPASSLAQRVDVALATGVDREADHLRLVPTCSTTAALAVGDALAVVLAARKGLTEREFRACHPGGALGALPARPGREVPYP